MCAKNQVKNYSNFTITLPMIYSPGDFLKVLLKFKMAATDQFHFCKRKNSNTWSEIIQILRSHFPPYGDVLVILIKFEMAATSLLF